MIYHAYHENFFPFQVYSAFDEAKGEENTPPADETAESVRLLWLAELFSDGNTTRLLVHSFHIRTAQFSVESTALS